MFAALSPRQLAKDMQLWRHMHGGQAFSWFDRSHHPPSGTDILKTTYTHACITLPYSFTLILLQTFQRRVSATLFIVLLPLFHWSMTQWSHSHTHTLAELAMWFERPIWTWLCQGNALKENHAPTFTWILPPSLSQLEPKNRLINS